MNNNICDSNNNNNHNDNNNNNNNSNNNNNMDNGNTINDNNTNVRPKRLSPINTLNSIKFSLAIYNTHKRRFNPNAVININNINNNTNQAEVKKIKYTDNVSLLHADNVLIPAILSNCFSYLELKELNLIINRVNKYWKSNTYNNITLGYRPLRLNAKHYKLLVEYINNTNNGDSSNNNNNEAVNLLTRLKYSPSISLLGLSSVELFLNIIISAKYIQTLTLDWDEKFNYSAINDELWRDIRLDKLGSFNVGFDLQEDGVFCVYFLTKLMKCIDLHKITSIGLHGDIHSIPLQVFDNNPFINLTTLILVVGVNLARTDNWNYLSNLTQLTELKLGFVAFSRHELSFGNWNRLKKLTNLEEVLIFTSQPITFSISGQTDCVKALTTLPKLRILRMYTNLLTGPNEFLQLFSQFRCLTGLSIAGIDCNASELNRITFPTIASLTYVGIERNSASVIPVLKSNPQLLCINFELENVDAKVMMAILLVAPGLMEYTFTRTEVNPIITCSETYPHSLVTSITATHKIFINSNSRQQFINRIKQHLQPDYKCPNTNPACHEYVP